MNPIAIIVLFYVVLAAFIAGAAFSQKRPFRLASAAAALAWSCFMLSAASWAERLNYNAWYSNAASKMLDAFVVGIEQGRQDAVLSEMRRMTNALVVTYERRGNFKELAERAAANLTTAKARLDDSTNRR